MLLNYFFIILYYIYKGEDEMFCSRCGKENEDSTKFCIACGAPLAENTIEV